MSSFLEGFLNKQISRSLKIIYKMNEIKFTSKTKNFDLLFLLKNTLNSFTNFKGSYSKYLIAAIFNTYIEFLPFLIVCIISFSIILILMTGAGILIVLQMKRMMNGIYGILLSRREKVFQEKIDNLKQFTQLLEELQANFYYQDMISFNKIKKDESQNQVEGQFTDITPKNSKNNKNEIKQQKMMQNKRRKNREFRSVSIFFCYNLGISATLIIVYFVFQIFFAGVVGILITYQIQTSLYITEKIAVSDGLLTYNLLTSNSILSFLVMGKDYKILNLAPQIGLEALLSKNQEMVSLALQFDQPSQNSFYADSWTESYVIRASKTNICEVFPFLNSRQELCRNLENEIPRNGMIQTYIRNIDYIKGILLLLQNNKYKYDSDKILNDFEYIEWEYSSEVMYWQAYREISLKLVERSKKLSSEDVSTLTNTLTITLIVFQITTSIFMVVAIFNLYLQVNKCMFNFQLIPLNLVIENGLVKGKFLGLVRLNRNYF